MSQAKTPNLLELCAPMARDFTESTRNAAADVRRWASMTDSTVRRRSRSDRLAASIYVPCITSRCCFSTWASRVWCKLAPPFDSSICWTCPQLRQVSRPVWRRIACTPVIAAVDGLHGVLLASTRQHEPVIAASERHVDPRLGVYAGDWYWCVHVGIGLDAYTT